MKRTRRKRSLSFFDSYAPLEDRRLLAGDVSAFIEGDVLLVIGDTSSNQVQIARASDGQITIEGTDTTINGSSAPFSVAGNFRRMTMSLGDGDDQADLNSLAISRSLSFFGGSGNDQLTMTTVQARYIHIQGNDGDDVVEFNGVTDRKSTYVYLGDGDDIFSVTSLATGKNFKVFAGNGDDIFVSRSLSVGRTFHLSLDNGNDQALLVGNSTVRKTTKFKLGNGDDFLGVLPQQNNETNIFHKRVKVAAGAGSDSVVFDSGVTLRKPSRVDGSSGTDSIDTGNAKFNSHTRFRSFENESIASNDLGDRIDNLFTRLTAVGIDTSTFGDATAPPTSSTIQLTVNSEQLAFTENDAPLSIDPALEILGADNESIVSATVLVQGGTAGEDALVFGNTPSVSGSFDSISGTLTFTGVALPADYQAALRNVRFSNLSDNPSTDDRTVTISLQSELAVLPIVSERGIQVVAVDDPLQLNLPGRFGATAPINFDLNELITFTAQGTDPDNEFVYRLDLDGSGISASAQQPAIDSASGQFSWAPSESGTFPIRVIISNDIGGADQEEFTVTVS